jgi:aspartyl-tRNA(Asn)/glutamyl-tRNA(Gln) amidotransferase subunit A
VAEAQHQQSLVTDLVWTPLARLARLIAAKEISPVEVVRAYLERIERLDRTLGAFITVCAEDALAGARSAEAALVRGQAVGPLHGVPIGLKDLFDTRGVKTTSGSKLFADWVPPEDATVVARLASAGAIVIGKLNMTELAYGPDGVNDRYGSPRNPWDAAAHRIAGGSSSGSAVAVAAGLCAGALGSDTAGSIRVPSALCGITGLKPTYGRVSRAGVRPLAWSMDHVGPMTRSAADAALLLSVIAGHDEHDPTSSGVPVPDYAAALSGDVRGLKIGLLRTFSDEADAVVSRAVAEAATVLAGLGATIEETSFPLAARARAVGATIVSSEAATYHEKWLRSRPGDYAPAVYERLRAALGSASRYAEAQAGRAAIRDAVHALLSSYDVVLAPTTPSAATPLGQREVVLHGKSHEVCANLLRFTRVFNVSGHPTASVPCGFTPDGLPIGMQIVGRPFDEATVLRMADAYQRVTSFHDRRPPLLG